MFPPKNGSVFVDDDNMLKVVEVTGEGVEVGGRKVYSLPFADDALGVSGTPGELQDKLDNDAVCSKVNAKVRLNGWDEGRHQFNVRVRRRK